MIPNTSIWSASTKRATFPLAAHSSGRYLVDASGRPFRIHGEQAWISMPSFSAGDFSLFINTLAAQGVNALTLMLLNHDYEEHTGKTPGTGPQSNNGTWPFLKDTTGATYAGTGITSPPNGSSTTTVTNADMSTTNSSYFAIMDSYLTAMANVGMLAVLFPAYMGFQGLIEGWASDKAASGSSKCYTYGNFVGNRYKGYPNILWMSGGDYAPDTWSGTLLTCEEQMFQGLVDAGAGAAAGQLIGGHYPYHEGLATDISNTSSLLHGWMSINSIYVLNNVEGSYSHAAVAWGVSPAIPCFNMDPSEYEFQSGVTTQNTRNGCWWGALATIAGEMMANQPVWYSGSTTFASVNTTSGILSAGHVHHTIMTRFFDSIAWWTLIPSGTSGFRTIVTSGGGTNGGADFITAAGNVDGTLIVAYVPSAHSGSFTVDTSFSTGHGKMRARWLDPTTGNFQTASGSPFTPGGSQSFTVPGTNSAGDSDWTLLLETIG